MKASYLIAKKEEVESLLANSASEGNRLLEQGCTEILFEIADPKLLKMSESLHIYRAFANTIVRIVPTAQGYIRQQNLEPIKRPKGRVRAGVKKVVKRNQPGLIQASITEPKLNGARAAAIRRLTEMTPA